VAVFVAATALGAVLLILMVVILIVGLVAFAVAQSRNEHEDDVQALRSHGRRL
jgi:Tfp pilus assembly protein PilX